MRSRLIDPLVFLDVVGDKSGFLLRYRYRDSLALVSAVYIQELESWRAGYLRAPVRIEGGEWSHVCEFGD
jgi:hypothetical protein